MLLVGYDEGVGPSFYFLDYLASMQKLDYGSHGYGGFFCNRCALCRPSDCSFLWTRSCVALTNVLPAFRSPYSLLDTHWRADLSEEEGLALLERCFAEVQKRFMISMPNFTIKIVDKDGVRVVERKSK
jgi:20S proteasome alpha/beta subunit